MKLQIYFLQFFLLLGYFQLVNSTNNSTDSYNQDFHERTRTTNNGTENFVTPAMNPLLPTKNYSQNSCPSTVLQFQLPKFSSLILKLRYTFPWKELNVSESSAITFYLTFFPTINIEPVIVFNYNDTNTDVLVAYCSDTVKKNCILFTDPSTKPILPDGWEKNKTENEITLQKSIFDSGDDEITVSMYAIDEGTNCNLAFVDFDFIPWETQTESILSTTTPPSTTTTTTGKKESENSWNSDGTLIILLFIIWLLVILVSTAYLIASIISTKQMMAYKSPFK